MSAPQKELRLALICYGGVSLAVYMHGITKELWKLLKASEARKAGRPAAGGDSDPVWRALLDGLEPAIDLSVVCDILAGASAGGINAVLLARAIAEGHDMEPLRDLWLERADVERMLDPEARPAAALGGRLARFYKEPVAWFAARQSDSLASVDVPEVRAEIALKLAGFVRARWFEPPFSGDGFTAMLDEAMTAMEAGAPGVPLVPPTLAVDLFVTATDYFGTMTPLSIHSPPRVTEREHRRLFAFTSPAPLPQEGGTAGCPRMPLGDRPALVLAARATASFPGAFPPATITEIDRRCAATGTDWPGRAVFAQRMLAGDRPPEEVALIDGSVLNNAPFGPAIAAIRTRPAWREVDRRFVYVDPKPGLAGVTDAFDNAQPGFFTAIYRAMADIPREQPIRDSLDAINAVSARVRRMAAVIEGMTPHVDAAIERAVGPRFFLLPLSAQRLGRARSRVHSVAAREAGFAYAAYAQLKMRVVLDEAAQLAGAATDGQRAALVAAAAARGAFDLAQPLDRSAYVGLLKGLDIGFRVRRLRFALRHVSAAIAPVDDPGARAVLEALKAGLHARTAPLQAMRSPGAPENASRFEATRQCTAAGDWDGALDALARAMKLPAGDAGPDRLVAQAAGDARLPRPIRQALVRAWLGFPFYDIALLPLMQDDSADSFDELKVDRISPDDSVRLRPGGARACLKGWQLNAFAAFFSRAYRENDYLWGRLHAAERLLDILLSATGTAGAGVDRQAVLDALLGAILQGEKPWLREIAPLFDELEAQLAGPPETAADAPVNPAGS